MTSPITASDLLAAVVSLIKGTATLVAAISVIVTVMWAAGWPWVERKLTDFYTAMQAPVVKRLDLQRETLNALSSRIGSIDARIGPSVPVVEVVGNGLVMDKGPFRQDDTVPIQFFLRRNSPCPTEVLVQFFSAKENRVMTRFTKRITATPAPASLHHVPFRVDVAIPKDLPPGLYSYNAVLEPDIRKCPDQEVIHVPPSEFFEVIKSDP